LLKLTTPKIQLTIRMFYLFKRAEVSSIKKFYHTNLIQIIRVLSLRKEKKL